MRIIKLFSLLLLLGSTSMAQAALSCSELDEMHQDVSELADAVDSSFAFSPEEDEILALVVEAVYVVAAEEDNRTLANNAARMESAWNRQDANAYVNALDRVSDEVADIYNTEC